MEKNTLKIGFIGGALDSAVGLTHKISAQMDGRWRLCAGCFSTDSGINTQTGASWGIDSDRVYDKWQDLLDREKNTLDAISVLTPTPTHAEIVAAAIKQGYPVICEKALAATSDEVKKLMALTVEHNGFLAVTYNYTGYPMMRELQGLVRAGHLGKLNQIHIEMPQEGFARLGRDNTKPLPQAWRLKDGDIPTLSLDLGTHLHNIIHFLSGEKPIEVVALNNSFGFFKHVVDNTMCIAHYTSNLDCLIWFGKSALGHSNGLRVRVYGANGSAEWFQMTPELLVLHDQYGRKKILERSCADIEIANDARYNRFKSGHPAGFIEAFANYYYDLADSIIAFKEGSPEANTWVFGAEEALEGIVMLEAMLVSAKNKCWMLVSQKT